MFASNHLPVTEALHFPFPFRRDLGNVRRNANPPRRVDIAATEKS
jgi:hypothetical protein